MDLGWNSVWQISLCAAVLFAPLLPAQTSIAAAMAARRSVVSSSVTQRESDAPPATLEAALHAMFTSAAVVFTGEVTAIVHEAGAVVVRWQVQEAVRGVSAGSVYAQREWRGLWEGDATRFFVGERALVMLHAPSAAGYATPVGGGDGVIPLRGNAGNSVLDLRLLAQRVLVTDAARLRPMQALQAAGGSIPLSNNLQARSAAAYGNYVSSQRTLLRAPDVDSSTAEAGETAASSSSASMPLASAGSMDGTMVMGMLRAWQRDAGVTK